MTNRVDCKTAEPDRNAANASDCRRPIRWVRYCDCLWPHWSSGVTFTIKLDPDLEKALSARSAALKQPKSVLVRNALRAYLNQSASAYELGRDLFARHKGPRVLAQSRKKYLAEVLDEKRRGSKKCAQD